MKIERRRGSRRGIRYDLQRKGNRNWVSNFLHNHARMQKQPNRQHKKASTGNCIPTGQIIPKEKQGGVVKQEDREQVHNKDID